MLHRIKFLFCLALVGSQLAAQVRPKAIIFDSDMGPDYDDVGAIAMLHAFADSGQIRLLATVASTRYEGVAAVFNVFNTFFGRPGIPIGVPGDHASALKDRQHWTDTLLARFPHRVRLNKEVPSAVTVYRKVLASQPDHSVTVVTTGFLTNLSDLLASRPDRYSDKTGLELVRLKVKELVSMAGRFPSGSEFNVRIDAAASRNVFINWPTPILLSGFEIGNPIRTGIPLVRNENIRNSPVKDVFRISIPLDPQDSLGRMSWDETAVLVAVKGYKPWYSTRGGKMIVNEDGSNEWVPGDNSHSYLVEAQPPVIVERLINKLIQHQPLRGK
jgi:inosine-uridine nucleoside N-ribohydrolase